MKRMTKITNFWFPWCVLESGEWWIRERDEFCSQRQLVILTVTKMVRRGIATFGQAQSKLKDNVTVGDERQRVTCWRWRQQPRQRRQRRRCCCCCCCCWWWCWWWWRRRWWWWWWWWRRRWWWKWWWWWRRRRWWWWWWCSWWRQR